MECSFYGEDYGRSLERRNNKSDGKPPVFTMSHINFNELHTTKAHSIPIIEQIKPYAQIPKCRSLSYPFVWSEIGEIF